MSRPIDALDLIEGFGLSDDHADQGGLIGMFRFMGHVHTTSLFTIVELLLEVRTSEHARR